MGKINRRKGDQNHEEDKEKHGKGERKGGERRKDEG